MGGFRRIYPRGNEELYAKFFNQSTSLCAETAASRARSELSKLQREDIESKQRELEQYRKRFSGSRTGVARTGGGAGAVGGDMRPESPGNERRVRPKGLPIKRRVPYFRIPLYSKKMGVEETKSPADGRASGQEDQELESGPVPYGEGVSPLAIREEEELERLAGLRLRDSLVRGLMVSDQLQASIKKGCCAQPGMDSAPQQPNIFTTNCKYFQEAGQGIAMGIASSVPIAHHTPCDYEQRLVETTKTTPLHALPGNLSTVKINDSPLLQHQHGHWKQNLQRRQQAHTSTQTNSATNFRPAPNRYVQDGGGLKIILEVYCFPRYVKQAHAGSSMLTRCKRPQESSLTINPQVLGLSIISAPIRLATRNHPIPRTNSEHWSTAGAMVTHELSTQDLKHTALQFKATQSSTT